MMDQAKQTADYIHQTKQENIPDLHTMDCYVEELSRIGSIYVIIQSKSADPPIHEIPRLQITSPQQISLVFDSIPPLTVDLTSCVRLDAIINLQQHISLRNGTLSVKLPSSQETTNDRSRNTLMETPYQWDTKYLKSLSPFTLNCALCSQELMNSKDITHISEMPSELWAEMMDFWHCHKPHDEHAVDVGHKFELKIPDNTILTASYYFAVNLNDVSLKNSVVRENEQIYCQKCGHRVGELDKLNKVDKLLKWEITIDGNDRYDPYQFVYFTLLDNVNGTATRIIEFISKENPSTKRVLIWIFNTEVNFALGDDSKVYKNALKLYYTTIPDNIDEERNNRGEIEAIFVTEKIMDDTLKKLDETNRSLPLSIRTMGKGWNLSLLYN